jgi:hypothetical protein
MSLRLLNKNHSSHSRILGRLIGEAEGSPCGQQHAAAMVCGRKVLFMGTNTDKNCVRTGTPCQHAERKVAQRSCFKGSSLLRHQQQCFEEAQ